jgi:hypothetical protein
MQIREMIDRTGSLTVLFNLLDFPAEAAYLRKVFDSSVRLIHLSHGLDSTDILIDQQFHEAYGSNRRGRSNSCMLGAKLNHEAAYRRNLDACICLAPLDAELERWLGSRRTMVVGKPIREHRLMLKPIDGRVGCVATLDHPPNLHGLEVLFHAVTGKKSNDLEFRLVGSPKSVGRRLASSFPFVHYLGILSDQELRDEAATWCSFINPIFSYARGCSTKLGVVLGWGLPILTTSAGARGYVWDEKIQPFATTATDLASRIFENKSSSRVVTSSEATLKLAQLQPSREQAAKSLRQFLSAINESES